MITAIELVGLPGCGKSTLIKECAPNPRRIIRREALWTNAEERVFLRCLLQRPSLMHPVLYNYINTYPEADGLFVRKLVELHHKLTSPQSALALLDEGLLSHITSIPFDREIVVDDAFREMTSLAEGFTVLVFDCRCPIETAIERLRSRDRIGDNSRGRYYDENDEALKAKLRIKQQNIDTVLSFYNGRRVELDMLQPLGTNASIIKRTVSELFLELKGELWMKSNFDK